MTRGIAANGFCIIGLALIVFGLWQAWPPLAFTAAGVGLVAIGVHGHRSGK